MHKWILSFALLAFLFMGQEASAQDRAAAAPAANTTVAANPISDLLDLLRKDYQATAELVDVANRSAQYLPTRNHENYEAFKGIFLKKLSYYMPEADHSRLKADAKFADILQRLYRQAGRR